MKRVFPFSPIPLPYSYNGLMPQVGAKTLYYHYEKLYKNYVNRLNIAIEAKPEYKELSLEEIIMKAKEVPKDEDIRRSAGGTYNHEMYFTSLSPEITSFEDSGCEPFMEAVRADYFTPDSFLETIAEEANGVFGSGYAWVAADRRGKIYVAKFANQDTPLTREDVPLLPIDVWEHAYYLDYQHERAKYVEEVLRIVDWVKVGERYCNISFS